MPKKFYTSMPAGYTVCQHGDCKMASQCLHQLAYQQLIEQASVLPLLNPRDCSKDEQCVHYRPNTPVVYARGFTNFQRRMYPDQYRQFTRMLIGIFSRNSFYERRRGVTALSPREQEIVLGALRVVGVTEELKFDSYEKNINWKD